MSEERFTLDDLVREVGAWAQRNFGEQRSKQTGQVLGSIAPLLGMQEEVGELTHCVLKRHQGIRGFDDDSHYTKHRDDAIADIVIYLADFCAREGVDLEEVVAETWAKVRGRDWVAKPVTAADEQDIKVPANKCPGCGCDVATMRVCPTCAARGIKWQG